MDAREIIARAREEQKKSLKQLQQDSGLSYETISRYLSNKQTLSKDSLLRLGEALGLDEDELLGEREFKPQHGRIYGFIDVRGNIVRISSENDLKHLYQQICVKEVELQREARDLIAEATRRIKENKKASAVAVNVEDLFTLEEYDTAQVLVHPFRTSDDEVDDEPNALGNMCVGYPFEMDGYTWLCSESAYIAGLFSEDNPHHIAIQEELLKEGNGYQAKKSLRKHNERLKRADWEDFNVQWMLHVVWSKCCGNQVFREMLLRAPMNAYIIENSSLQKGETAAFWGCQNPEWKHAREVVEKCVEIKHSNDLKRRKMLERQKINQIGVYRGVNCMGKILMLCRQALKNGVAPSIDYDLLRSKNIHLFGKRLDF